MNEMVIDTVKEVAKEVVHLNFSTMNWPGSLALSVFSMAGTYAFGEYMKTAQRHTHRGRTVDAVYTRKQQTMFS